MDVRCIVMPALMEQTVGDNCATYCWSAMLKGQGSAYARIAKITNRYLIDCSKSRTR